MDHKSARQKLALRKAVAAKKSTPSSRRHHFEPFTQRIARLKIDPIRRQRTTVEDRDTSVLTSHFRAALERWKESNLSEDFTKFSRQVESLCDNLPQVLHHQDRIIELLWEYIEKGNTVSVEPLLDLVPRLAQDLQAQFEKHFERTVNIVASLAARHQDVEVVEWGFNCLAWLFKYLEKLLISDLCPLYDLLAPLLGRERQKAFIVRFAAESLSFLVKKCSKDGSSLLKLVRHVLNDLCKTSEERNTGLYEEGIVTLFAEAINGVQGNIYSRGDTIFSTLLSEVFEINHQSFANWVSAARMFHGVLLSVLNHTHMEAFQPLLEILLNRSQITNTSFSMSTVALSAQLLLLVSSVRKGSRVVNWSGVLQILTSHVRFISSQDPHEHLAAATDVLSAFAVAHQSCPLDAAVSNIKTFDEICSFRWQRLFVGFCSLYSELGSDRFRSLLLPYFHKFIATLWDGQIPALCVLLPKLIRNGHLLPGSIKLSRSWQSKIADEFEELLASPDPLSSERSSEIFYLNGLLEILKTVPMDDNVQTRITRWMHHTLTSFLRSNVEPTVPEHLLVLGNCLRYLAENPKTDQGLDLWPLLCSASTQFQSLPFYFENILEFVQERSGAIDLDIPEVEKLQQSLVNCLSSPSHELRLACLEILRILTASKNSGVADAFALALSIERTQPSIETVRSISLQLRNLATNYHTFSSNPLLAKAIPYLCFGLLHVKLAQVAEDACNVLKEICTTKEGEDVVCELAFRWLEDAKVTRADSPTDLLPQTMQPVFYGLALGKTQALAKQNMALNTSALHDLEVMFNHRHTRMPLMIPANRTHALRVLRTVPRVAEKKSRHLVPVLLSWAQQWQLSPDLHDNSTEANYPTEYKEPGRWSRKDQKALLSVFALFINPRVLYKADQLYSALLSLLEHGDVEIQNSAMKAIFTWKNPSVNRYEEDLLKLLDDAKFREQITIFLDSSNGESSLQDKDRHDAVPIILRLLYGRVINRGKADQRSNRKAVFVLLSRFHRTEVNEFIDIALGPVKYLRLVEGGALKQQQLTAEFLSQRRQFGLLNMFKDLLDTWRSTAAPYTHRLVDPVFYCLVNAAREINANSNLQDPTQTAERKMSLARSIRQVSLQCLNTLFEIDAECDWDLYYPTLLKDVIEPRLEKLAIETAQGTSGLLKTFATWAQSIRLAPYLAKFGSPLLSKIAECISLGSAKDEVKRFVINDILHALVMLAKQESKPGPLTSMINNHSWTFLVQLGLLLSSSPPKDILEAGVAAVADLALYNAKCPTEVLSIIPDLLQAPSRLVSPRTKKELLRILLHFSPTLKLEDEIHARIFSAVCSSFALSTDGESRSLLSKLARVFAQGDDGLSEAAELCEELNSFTTDRLEAPDFDRRAAAFNTINEERFSQFTSKQWQLLLGNLMFYIKDVNELAIRASASYGLRRFVEAASLKSQDKSGEFLRMVDETIITGVERGLRDQPEVVQAEYLTILAHVVRFHPTWSAVSDLQCLLAEEEEDSFFFNALHIQQYRRIRATKRLAEEIRLGKLSSNNLYRLFVPLLENFIFSSGDTVVAGEAVRSLGVLIEWIDWQQCRVLLRRYVGYVQSKPDMQETILKLLDTVTNTICQSTQLKQLRMEKASENGLSSPGTMNNLPRLAASMPGKEKLSQYLLQDILPPLSAFLHEKDESFVSRRVSVAVIATRFLQVLSSDEFQIRLPPLLIDVCNILRSKDQGSRDMTRKALTTICTIIGPSSIGFVLRELRTCLQRGFYLHVLSFTVHSILETTAPSFQVGDLDYCVSDIVAIIMDDIFGNAGSEKEAAEFLKDKNTKKEVKGKKSFDSMQLLASVTSLHHLIDLVRPIKMLLLGSLNNKGVRNVDELLRRIELGLLQNHAVRGRDVLVFCYEIIQDTRQMSSIPNTTTPGSKSAGNGLQASEVIGKITRFALEIIRSVFRKHKDLLTPTTVSGLLPLIGDALLSNQEGVKLAAIRLFTVIINVPLPRIDSDAPVYISEAARIIEDAQRGNDELSQAALKLISAVLRERRSAPVKIKDRTVAILLHSLKPDLQVISQQGAAFNLLRSIIGRKIIIPEVYEIIDGDDGVAAISVRDHDRTTRDLARGVYFQFLMEYPQGKGRFTKQLAFIIRNLEYDHPEGRLSVMEILHLLLNKVNDALVQEIIREAFWPLVSVLVNDESSDCRKIAASLIKVVFARSSDEWTKSFLALFRRLLEGDTKHVQKRTALQCWTLFLEVKDSEASEVSFVMKQLEHILDYEGVAYSSEDWQLVYNALHTFLVLCKHRPDETFGPTAKPIWTAIHNMLSFPQLWVKQEAAELIGLYAADFARSNAEGLSALPLVGTRGLKVDRNEMQDLTARNLGLLREGISKELAAQAIRNLAFLGRCFAANGAQWHRRQEHSAVTDMGLDSEGDEEENEGEDGMNSLGESEDSTAIEYIFQKLAKILRRELRKPQDPSDIIHRRAEALYPKSAALQLSAALCNILPSPILTLSAEIIILPLVHLTDSQITAPSSADAAFGEAYNELVNNATELMDLLQRKLGTTEYVKALQRVKRQVQKRRNERRQKRKIEAVSMPEKIERMKKRKRQADKVRRKEKGAMERGKRRGW